MLFGRLGVKVRIAFILAFASIFHSVVHWFGEVSGAFAHQAEGV